MAFTYKHGANRQRSTGPFRVFGGLTQIIIGNGSSPVLSFVVAYYSILYLVSF